MPADDTRRPAPLTVEQAAAITDAFTARRDRFPQEGPATSLLVVLLNWGDHLTAVSCIAGEWSGVKGDIPHDPTVRVLPVCPNGHPLLEGFDRWRLGLVHEPAAPVAPPPGCEEVDGVAWCVVHDGVVDELSDRLDDDGEPRCDMCDELDDACRIVPLFLRVEEADHG